MIMIDTDLLIGGGQDLGAMQAYKRSRGLGLCDGILACAAVACY